MCLDVYVYIRGCYNDVIYLLIINPWTEKIVKRIEKFLF